MYIKDKIAFKASLKQYNEAFLVFDERFSQAIILDWIPDSMQILGTSSIPSGEDAKSMVTVERLWREMLVAQVDRNSLLVSFGGGSTTDVAGFVASTFKRGIAVAHVPTTLMAMVDAAIGGKTGINFNGSKNQIGTFHLPVAIGVDPVWLESLPLQHWVCGWMEMMKHAFIDSPESAENALGIEDLSELKKFISQSANIKSQIVNVDCHEAGQRKALNFGHTVGHAIESCCMSNGTSMPHGIAVGYGMLFSMIASVDLGAGLTQHQADLAIQRIRHWLKPYPLPPLSAGALWTWMLLDKKNKNQKVMEVWLADWGKPRWDQPLDFADFQRIWMKTTSEIAR